MDTTTDAARAVREAWAAHLGEAAATPDTNFFTAGGNSLMAAAILGGLSERFGHGLPMRLLVRNPTLGGLCDAVGELLAGAGNPARPPEPRRPASSGQAAEPDRPWD
ncbi:acyl carrier protein [Amycolatopsis mediterranei]|uniref:acyl carrier protein n=1 Tax=Amycolatopsis mediterranei TaxID=33910 RepID=UPI00342C7E4A